MTISPAIDLSGLRAAVLGGDERETETIRLLARHGAETTAYGCPPSAAQALGGPQASRVGQAIAGASIIICPIPLPSADGSLYAPHAATPIVLDANLLREAAAEAVLITGTATPAMRQAAASLDLRLHEYEADDELMILRAAAIAEGAVAIAIGRSSYTLHQSPALVVGFGRIGTALGHLLLGMRARTSVATRSTVGRARAYEMGHSAYALERLGDLLVASRFVFSTVPAPLFDAALIERLESDALLIDLAAPPGSVDHQAARALGRNVVWARGLGGVAPKTVAESQWIGIMRLLHADGIGHLNVSSEIQQRR